jgi:RNA polymerase sigma-70 factor (ECF subfamily)
VSAAVIRRRDSDPQRAFHDEHAHALWWRWASRRPELVTDQVPDQPVADTAQQTVDRQLVLTALRRLSTEHRQVLFECYLRGTSVADAAEILGVPPGTIKSRTHYALHGLRQAIEDLGGVPVRRLDS